MGYSTGCGCGCGRRVHVGMNVPMYCQDQAVNFLISPDMGLHTLRVIQAINNSAIR